ncbi:hypothetical protein [Hyphomonas sp.]|uniref:hypothetical protein n=1 Tax=Hyphomonas sp. TaxID=87 RepID=UPI00391A65AB
MDLLGERGNRDIDSFCEHSSSWWHAYDRVGISVVALKQSGDWYLYAARIGFGSLPVSPRSFETSKVFAASFELVGGFEDPSDWLKNLLSVGISLPDRHIEMRPSERGDRLSTHFVEYDRGPSADTKSAVLRVHGSRFEQLESKDALDIHLMAADEPFASFQELLNEYSVADPGGSGNYLEIFANVPCVIDRPSSSLSSGRSVIVLNCLPGLDVEKIKIGLQIFDHQSVQRRSISGARLSWAPADTLKRGTFIEEAPSTSVVRVFVSYADELMNHVWLSDPDRSLNVRRGIHSTFDPRLELIQNMLSKSPESRQDSREFEAAIGWLFWMLGFNPIAWHASKRLSDAPDLVVQSDDGRILVVEATIGTLKQENKLPLLLERTQRIRQALESVNVRPTIVPIICTALEDDAIGIDLEAAQSLGIGVLSAPTLSSLLSRTIVFPNSNAVMTEIEAALQNWRERRQD